MENKDKTAAEFGLDKITPEQVLSAYSGRTGCACGCRGKYWYNSARVEEASNDRGYAVSPDEVSDAQVKRVLRLLQTHSDTLVQDGYIAWLEKSNRLYMVHLGKEFTTNKSGETPARA